MMKLSRVDARVPFAIVALIAGLLAVALPAAADPNDRLDRIRAEKEHAAAQEAKFAEKQEGLLARVGVLDRKRARVETTVQEFDAKLDVLDGRISAVKDDLEAAQQKVSILTEDLQDVLGDLGTSTDLFTQRAIEAYKGGPGAYIETILGAESFTDLVDNISYWEAILDSDSELIDNISVLRDETENRREVILEKQHDIAVAKQDLEDNRTEIAAIRAQHADVLAQREALLSEKEGLLAQVEGRKSFWQAVQDELDRESAKIEALLAGGSTGTFPTGGGQFLWPTAGAMTSPYGYRVHPIFGDRRLHTGIDIGGGYGNPVIAAETGTVTYVGAMSGYGNVVIIDHGGGLATTYNHLSAQYVSSGSVVQRGTSVGAVGCTGYCTGPHLHFEVRVNGSPVDPLPYLQ